MRQLLKLFAVFLIVFSLTACNQQAGDNAQTGDDTETRKPVQVKTETDPNDLVLAWIDGRPVTESDLVGFSARHLGASHSDPHSPEGSPGKDLEFADTFQAYVRYRVLVDEGYRRDLAAGKDFEDWKTLRRLVLLAPTYRSHVMKYAAITPDKIQAAMPSRMIQMNFAIKAFPTMEAAWEGKEKIFSLKDFESLPDGFGRTAKRITSGNEPETGLIWPDSGFFGKADDGYLFTLSEGDVSDPVESGLGATLSYVLKKKVYSEEEKAAYLEMIRGKLAEDYVKMEVKRVVEEGPYRIYDEVVKEIWEDSGFDTEELDLVVMEFNGIKVTYRVAHFLQTFNYGYMRRMYSSDSYHEWVIGQLKNLAKNMSQGFEGEKLSAPHPEHLEDRLEVELDDFLYQRVQYLVTSSYEPDIGSEEVRAFYDSGRDRFKTRDFIIIDYYFSPYIGELEASLQKVKEGVDFYELAQYLPKQGKAPHAASAEGPLKTGTFYRGGPGLSGVDQDLFRYMIGEMDVLTSGMGEYLIRIKERIEGKQLEFDDVKERIEDGLLERKRRAHLSSTVKDLIEKARITFSKDGEKEIKGIPAGPFQETG